MRTSGARRAAAVLVATALTGAMVGGLVGCADAGTTGGSPAPAGEPAEGAAEETSDDLLGGLPGGGVACVDWVRFATPEEAAADAGAVLLGTVVERDGAAQMFGVEAHRWLFDVEEVLERPVSGSSRANPAAEPPPELDVSPGEQISVVSTPETCGGADNPYPGGDPLDPATATATSTSTGARSVIVLLSGATDDGSTDDPVGFHLITPYQGVVSPEADGSLPAEWPATP
ncbi:hypothetical protein [Promicromonospora sp. NPDC019610]|uniref:hypothetical protein n=1 Tax=Promicromonospora sp. NPDC019610 TaxID=3364405 RepID=UPI003790F187